MARFNYFFRFTILLGVLTIFSGLLTAQTQSIEKILNKDGSIKKGINGAFNAKGYRAKLGKKGQPVFLKQKGNMQTNSTAAWSSLGTGRGGFNGDISAIAVVGSDIYFGGTFTMVDNIVAANIAKWNGSSWSNLPAGSSDGVQGNVYAIASVGTDIYIGGQFNKLGDGTPANNIAVWHTATNTWSVLPCDTTNGFNHLVATIAVSGTDVYIGGDFTALQDGTPANYVIKWNTATNSWVTLPCGSTNGLNYSVTSLALCGTDVYIGGSFSALNDGTSANDIVKWNTNTNTWSPLPCGAFEGVNAFVKTIAVNGTDVYIGGAFSILNNGTSANYIAKWNAATNTWSNLPCGTSNGTTGLVHSIAIAGNEIYIGGDFDTLANGTIVNHLAIYNPSTSGWSATTAGSGNGLFPGSAIEALAANGTTVYVGGNFSSLADTEIAYNAAKVNIGSSVISSIILNPDNSFISGDVYAVAVCGTDVFFGGTFTNLANGTSANHAAKWSTTTNTWSTLPVGSSNGVNSNVYCFAVNGSDVYIGGNFSTLGDGTPANGIVKWNTSSSTFSVLPCGTSNGISGEVDAIVLFGTDLYAGGYFLNLGDGTPAKCIAKWSTASNTWSVLPCGSSNGLSDEVYAIAAVGSDIYIGGYFSSLGDGTEANYIAKWNTVSNTWSVLPCGSSNGLSDGVYAIAAVGSDIYIGGYFSSLGDGTPVNFVVKWNVVSNTWATLPCGTTNGTYYWVSNFAISGPDLYVGGNFDQLGDGTIVNYIAKWNTVTNLWSALQNDVGVGVDGVIRALSVDMQAGKMFIGGSFVTIGSKAVYGVASFTDSDNPMPVELKSFTTNFSNGIVDLEWKTATEVNNSGFDIERKYSGSDWQKIGFVAGHGTSNSEHSYSFTEKLSMKGIVTYRLKQINTDGTFKYSSTAEANTGVVTKYMLAQNYPNPFNPNTTVNYQIPTAGNVTLKVFDVLGNEVATLVNDFMQPGSYNVSFNGSGYASGVYYYQLKAGKFIETKKCILMK